MSSDEDDVWIDLYNEHDPWANYYAREFQGPTNFEPRTRAESLNAWQSYSVDVNVRIHISIPAYGENSIGSTQNFNIPSFKGDKSSRLFFAIRGGSEFPHFAIWMNLVTQTGKGQSQTVRMNAIFPAWNRKGNDFVKLGQVVQLGQPLPLPPTHSTPIVRFSESLFDVQATRGVLPLEMREVFGFARNDESLRSSIRWTSYVEPVCINFGADTSHLSREQQNAAEIFRKVRNTPVTVTIIADPERQGLWANLAYLYNMPKRTLPPYPRYGAMFNKQNKTLKRIHVSDIYSLRGSKAGEMYVKRKPNWTNVGPGNLKQVIEYKGDQPVYVGTPMKGGSSNPGVRAGTAYFMSEREYEVTRIVGQAREVHYAESTAESLFNREYDFDLVPTGQTRTSAGMLHEFYIFINVRPVQNFRDTTATPPAPGMRVRIRIKDQRLQDSSNIAKNKGVMARDQSGTASSIVKYDQNSIHARTSGHVTNLQQRLTPVGPTARARATSTTSTGSSVIGSPSSQFARLTLTPSIEQVVTHKREDREWMGVVVPKTDAGHDDYDICIYVTVEETGMGMGLQDCRGHFTFGNLYPPHVQIEQAIHYVMYGEPQFFVIPSQGSWLKELLLAKENDNMRNRSFGLPYTGTIHYPPGQSLHHLQSKSVKISLSWPDTDVRNLNSRLSMITGPPGTGKTTVSATIAYHSYVTKEKLLMSAGSNYAVQNMADAVHKVLFGQRPTTQKWKDKNGNTHEEKTEWQSANGIWGIYRLGTEADEHFSNYIKNVEAPHQEMNADFESYNDGATPVNLPSNITDAEFRAVETWVKHRTSTNKKLSLGDHIMCRLQKARAEGSQWKADWQWAGLESELLHRFLAQRHQLSRLGLQYADFVGSTSAEREISDDALAKESRGLSKASLRTWRDIHTFYINHATIILCTASTAGRKTMRRFRAARVLIDEACQLTENEALNAIVRSFSNLHKIILVGDRNQLPPVVASRDQNEFANEQGRSLMVRMEDSGMTGVVLTEQRRMHPDISKFISVEFYNGQLTDHESVLERAPSTRFRNFCQHYFKSTGVASDPPKSNVYFVSVKGTSVWHRKGCTSLANPWFLEVLITILQPLYKAISGTHRDGKPVTFGIVSFYAEETNLLKKWLYKVAKLSDESVAVTTVDATQGKEYDYVLVSACRIGGKNGLGFVADRNRICVALSRAKHGLIVVGDENMINNIYMNKGAKTWSSFIKYCRSRNAIMSMTGNPARTASALNININRDWVKLEKGEDQDEYKYGEVS